MKFLPTLSLILSKVSLLKVIWKKWDIRTFLVASFTFQLILIISAPFRKRTSNLISRVTLWVSYLMADWVAAQAIGLIARATEPGDSQAVSVAQGYLFAFWAQFLLIHLGGPDTITALALEDNDLWLRTGLHLGMQATAALGVLFKSTMLSGLWAATVLMFLAGVIKYLERVMSLFHGRLMDLDEDPREYARQLDINHRAYGELTNVEMVRDGYNLFHLHKRLFTERDIGRTVRESTEKYFMRRSPEEAYKVLEVQLNFTYEAMYTKMVVTHRRAWKILRHVVLLMEVSGLVIWFLADKRGYVHYDIRITYNMVVGAIMVDVLAFLRIHFSDWNIAHLDKGCWNCGLYNMILAARSEGSTKQRSWFRRVFLGRWSESIHQIHKLDRIGRNMMKVIKFFNLEMFALRHWSMKKKRVSSEMWEFIFYEVVKIHKSESKKYKLANDKEVDIDSLVQTALPTNTLDQQYYEVCNKWIGDDTLYQLYPEMSIGISATLSRYLWYLLVFQTNMMFGAAGKEKLFKALDHAFGRQKKDERQSEDLDEEEDRCQMQSPSVVCDKLRETYGCTDEEKERLCNEFLARGYVRLLCYAAIRCSPRVHAESLREGGELLSFIWLLMVHLNVTKV